MSNLKKKQNGRHAVAYRPLMIAALVAGGIMQPLLRPAFAAGVTAGSTISNTATATYTDGVNPFDSTSNTVSIVVAEIAGITATPAGIKDLNAGAVEAGDTLNFDFKVTNVGNTPTGIFVPDATQVTPTNFLPTDVLVSLDGGVTFAPLSSFPGQTVPNVGPDTSIIVRVVGTVPTTGLTAGDPVKVTLGDTGPNDNTAATQNQPDAGPLGDVQTKDIRSIDGDPTTPTVGGQKEASASQFVPFATSITPLAMATVRKSATNVDPGLTPSGNDDLITYGLNLTVENQSLFASFSPAPLEGTAIKLNGTATASDYVMVSDVIPTGTVLDSVNTASLPANWTVVYSIDDPASSIPVVSTGPGAMAAANWTTVAPASLATVKRIGYIYNATANTPLAANGTAISGFAFTVKTSGLPTSGGSVANKAQAFGQTVGDPTNEIVYDESGDSLPNNFNDNSTPPDATGTNFNPATDTGTANPVLDGSDPGGNKGTGPAGEDNIVPITGTIPPANDSLFNGPLNRADAVGPTDANDDFTNLSATVPAGQQGAFDPTSVTFTNTVSNPSTVALSNVTIQPISPTQAELADGIAPTGQYGTNADIPVGTAVVVKYDANNDGTFEQAARYVYDGTKFTLTPNGTYPGTTPVVIGTMTPGQKANYVVEVDSTSTTPLASIPVPMLAFADDKPGDGYNGDGSTLHAGAIPELTNNVSIDRVYLGFMELVKEAQILNADGTVAEGWSQNPTTKAAPGQFIEYRIRYNNISTPANGSGNSVLNASNFKIVEDGAATVGTQLNSWAASTTHQKMTTTTQGTLEFFKDSVTSIGTVDPATGTTVGKYENKVGTVAPGSTGTFQFRRVVN
jgi:hypothetical protein